MQDYAVRAGRDTVHSTYPHQDPSIMLPDVDLQEPLSPQQLALVRLADVYGAMAQVCGPVDQQSVSIGPLALRRPPALVQPPKDAATAWCYGAVLGGREPVRGTFGSSVTCRTDLPARPLWLY